MTTATQIPTQQRRTFSLERNQAPDSDTLEFSFSSDEPYERWWGTEVLDHSPEAVDLSRLNDGGVFLWNHNTDIVLGSLQRAWIDGNKARCQIRWAKTEEAIKYRGLVEDGHLKNVSVGYSIQEIKSLEKETYRVTRWEPLEVSLVSVPADNSVGVGRSQDLPTAITIKETRSVDTTLTPPVTDPSPELLEKLRKQERERQTLIQKLGQHFNLPNDFQDRLSSSDYTPEQIKSEVLDFAAKKTSQPVATAHQPLGLSQREQKNYSVLKALNAAVNKNWDEAGFERECHNEISKRLGRSSGGVFVPVADLMVQQRVQQVAQPSLGGNLVETMLDESRFIDILRNRLAVAQMGATILSGLVGNLDIPRQTGASTAYWLGEGDQITDSSLNFDLVQLRLKTVAGIVGATRNMLLQTSLSAETLIRQDLVNVLALEIDRAALYGTGTNNQPLGIANQPGIQGVEFGVSNGGPPTWPKVVEFEQKLDSANALMGGLGYLTNPRVRAALKTTEKATSTAQFLLAEPGSTLNGYNLGISNQVRGNRTKGSGTNLSDIFFGNWADLLIGEWGVLELLPNELGAGYRFGIIEIRAMQSIDIAIRRAVSFVLATDVVAA